MTANACHKNSNGSGYALMTVLIIGALFFALTGALGMQVVTNLEASKTRQESSACRYGAYAGLQHALLNLIQNPSWGTNPDDALIGLKVPHSPHVSYTVEVTNNVDGAEGSELTAPDGTKVPAGAVYCAAMGIYDGRGTVQLHAMTGVIARRQPQLFHAAFTDSSLVLAGNATTGSFNPAQPPFTLDSNGAADLNMSAVNANGDVGTNRYVTLDENSMVQGSLSKPQDNQQQVDVSKVSGPIVDRPDPTKVPRFSVPKVAPSYYQAPMDISNPATLNATNSIYATTYQSLSLQGGDMHVAPGEYFFPDGIEINGTLTLDPSVTATEPVVFYVGNDAVFGDAARVNVGGDTRHFQLIFVDHDDGSPQEFRMLGNSQVFGAVVGGTAEGHLSDDASLFGGFMGRALTAEGNSKLLYDESLSNNPLIVNSKLGYSGVTEPKPDVVLFHYTATREFVESVYTGTATYQAPYQPSPSN